MMNKPVNSGSLNSSPVANARAMDAPAPNEGQAQQSLSYKDATEGFAEFASANLDAGSIELNPVDEQTYKGLFREADRPAGMPVPSFLRERGPILATLIETVARARQIQLSWIPVEGDHVIYSAFAQNCEAYNALNEDYQPHKTIIETLRWYALSLIRLPMPKKMGRGAALSGRMIALRRILLTYNSILGDDPVLIDEGLALNRTEELIRFPSKIANRPLGMIVNVLKALLIATVQDDDFRKVNEPILRYLNAHVHASWGGNLVRSSPIETKVGKDKIKHQVHVLPSVNANAIGVVSHADGAAIATINKTVSAHYRALKASKLEFERPVLRTAAARQTVSAVENLLAPLNKEIASRRAAIRSSCLQTYSPQLKRQVITTDEWSSKADAYIQTHPMQELANLIADFDRRIAACFAGLYATIDLSSIDQAAADWCASQEPHEVLEGNLEHALLAKSDADSE